MFGQNKITKPDYRDDGTLNVKEVFYTLQGEGPDAGMPAIFVRLVGCNFKCFFCDTNFDDGEPYDVERLLYEVFSVCDFGLPQLIVITGGEPFIQNILPFVQRANSAGFMVSVETAGAIVDGHAIEDGRFAKFFGKDQSSLPACLSNKIVCSPKAVSVSDALLPFIDAYKYVVGVGGCDDSDGLPKLSTQIEGRRAAIARPHDKRVPVFIQPMDVQDEAKNAENLYYAAQICLRHKYRLSCQLHKLAGLR